MRVAVPPMLLAKIWVSRKGTGLTFKIEVIANVIGPTRRTVVTLSRKADSAAVMMVNTAMIAHGLPWVSLADLIAMYSNNPEFLTTATKSIMPTSTPMVLTSTCSIALSTVNTWVTSRMTAPASDAAAR